MPVERVNLDDLDPESPEFEAAVAAADMEEIKATPAPADPEAEAEENEGTEQEGDPPPDQAEAPKTVETPPEGEAAAAAVVEGETAATPPAAPAAPEKPAPVGGVASKDGKKVLPYVVLSAAREETRTERTKRIKAEEEAKSLREENEALKAGKKPTPAPAAPSEEELAEVEAVAPTVAAHLKSTAARAQELEAENAALRAKAPAAPAPARSAAELADEAIDQIPLLATWRAADPEKFVRACEVDKVYMTSPKWKGRSAVERFAEVTRVVAKEYDVEVPDDDAPPTAAAPTPPAKARKDPAEVAANAPRTLPNTLSDFKGGESGKAEERLEKLHPVMQEERLANMSDADFERYLARLG